MFVERGNKSRLVLAALIAGSFVTQAALADVPAPLVEVVTRTVDLRGYDLSSPAGAQQALARISSAAESICGAKRRAYGGVAAARRNEEHARRCVEQAVSDALARITATTGIDVARVADSAAFVAER
ncbi:MAG TPA: UrcA family protein [Gammaproteobacteria bacterium]